jgi:hypothetical protein
LVALLFIFEMLFLPSEVLLVYVCLIHEGRVFTLEYIFILQKRSGLVGFELPVLVSERHALVLGHRTRYHLLHAFYALSVSSLLTAVFNE